MFFLSFQRLTGKSPESLEDLREIALDVDELEALEESDDDCTPSEEEEEEAEGQNQAEAN